MKKFRRQSLSRPAASVRRRLVRPRMRGFTLLEVIVSIGLTTLIVGVIGTAIRMYFINLRNAQANMELTELARNTLNLMAADIRSAIQYKPVDVSGLQELLDSQTAAVSNATGGNGSSDETDDDSAGDENSGNENAGDETPEGDNSAGGDSATDEGSSEDPNANSPSTDEPTEPPKNRPKFIGTNQEIYVDVSRLPRIDQYHPILHLNSNGSYTSLPTDVKGVSYFVSVEGDDSTPVPGGLYRREVDRATTDSPNDANLFGLDAAAKQVAAEIVSISLRYFDGESWQEQWDSDELGGYPSAVEVTIVIDPGRTNATPGSRYDLSAADSDTLRTFRTVTKLPLAEILSAEDQELIAKPTEFKAPTESAPATEDGR
jgi:type II secretory pathway pseudopilin PulG